MLCSFTTTDTPQTLTCPICKRDQRSKHPPERTYRECRIIEPCDEEITPAKSSLWQQLKSGMLGDVTESILSSVGLTKSRWEQIIGGPCGCGERQAWLNKVGQALMGNKKAE
jgi:hypothetical protein